MKRPTPSPAPYLAARLAASASLAASLVLVPAAHADPRIDVSTLPQDGGPVERVPSETVATMERGAFLESIAVRPDGTILFTEGTNHAIYRLDLGGEPTVWHESELEPTGLAIDVDGTVTVTGHDSNGVPSLFVFQGDGSLDRAIPVPDAGFVNGATFVAPGIALVADAKGGRIFRVDLKAGEIAVWLEDERLAPDPKRNELLPGANGVKVNDGYAYVSNTSRMTLLRVSLIGPDLSPGEIETVAENVVLDDFALAADGTVYGTTHIYDTVVRIEPDGSVATVATAEDGVVGSTAAAFGTGERAQTLYVVGDGGVYLDPDDVVPPKVVALDVSEDGLGTIASLAHVAYPGRIEPAQLSLVRCHTAGGSAEARERMAPLYTRFLELNYATIPFAGQVYGNGRDGAPTAREYFIAGHTVADAKRMMEGSPYFTGGVYARCEAEPFDSMLGTLTGGVAWPVATSGADAASIADAE